MKKYLMLMLSVSAFLTGVFVQAQSISDSPSEIAQQQPQHPALAAFSNCLHSAVNSERTEGVTNESLGRVKNTCRSELAAMKKALPKNVFNKIMVLLDEGLSRELNR